jgi:plasmid maintenance system antidote protein VapI
VKTKDYCRAAKIKLGVTSDYALAKHLGVQRQTISNYVNGHRVFDNTMAARISEILDVDLVKVIADLELERGTNDELWKRIARKVAAVAVVAIGAGSIGAPSPAPAQGTSVPTVCIM